MRLMGRYETLILIVAAALGVVAYAYFFGADLATLIGSDIGKMVGQVF